MGREEHGTAVATVHELFKQYDSRTVLDRVSFRILQGEVFGLLGPNGAGKTTLLECLTGLRKPTSGSIDVLGSDPSSRDSAWRRMVAVQPQEATLFPQLSVRETVELWASFYEEHDEVDAVLERVGLLEEGHQRVKALSGGQARRLLLAVTVIGRPRVLVLDEPAAGLDPQAKEHLWDVIRKHRDTGGTVLLTTHDMNEASELCDRVAVLVGGRIAACDTPARLVSELADSSTVSFTTSADADLTEISTFPGVTAMESAATPEGRIAVQVRTTIGDQTLRRIAADQNLLATDLGVSRGGLDAVFRSLATGKPSLDSKPKQQKAEH
ncbi:heme ABC exporter ATP-binding protein CcmA [Streptomyces sp. H27-D2]|uniref:heme ABC exporter ATP-binding protein CcmA n=1 Tax=Streptomyces sp. H27-D2 TaxID=3046304 RepID=UPI002DB7AE15|nr:heme ABC exporter ATP-binding protein CcmA [Streptomyces sp. H27-D2]MEC4020243.1 heme ABC exporter ATP-binding protein CcmA [Streptomyces sp. H27-D2]